MNNYCENKQKKHKNCLLEKYFFQILSLFTNQSFNRNGSKTRICLLYFSNTIAT